MNFNFHFHCENFIRKQGLPIQCFSRISDIIEFLKKKKNRHFPTKIRQNFFPKQVWEKSLVFFLFIQELKKSKFWAENLNEEWVCKEISQMMKKVEKDFGWKFLLKKNLKKILLKNIFKNKLRIFLLYLFLRERVGSDELVG